MATATKRAPQRAANGTAGRGRAGRSGLSTVAGLRGRLEVYTRYANALLGDGFRGLYYGAGLTDSDRAEFVHDTACAVILKEAEGKLESTTEKARLAYLRTAIRNALNDERAKRERRATDPADPAGELLASQELDELGPEEQAINRRTAVIVGQAFEEVLSEDERRIAQVFLIDEQPIRAGAEMLGLKKSTAVDRLDAVRAKLQRHLATHGIHNADEGLALREVAPILPLAPVAAEGEPSGLVERLVDATDRARESAINVMNGAGARAAEVSGVAGSGVSPRGVGALAAACLSIGGGAYCVTTDTNPLNLVREPARGEAAEAEPEPEVDATPPAASPAPAAPAPVASEPEAKAPSSGSQPEQQIAPATEQFGFEASAPSGGGGSSSGNAAGDGFGPGGGGSGGGGSGGGGGEFGIER